MRVKYQNGIHRADFFRFKIKHNQLMNRIMIRLPVTARQT